MDGKIYVFTASSTGKTKRVRATGRVRFAPCSMNGRGILGPWREGTGRVVHDEALHDKPLRPCSASRSSATWIAGALPPSRAWPPVARDRGTFRGRLMIVGGRAHVRRILYMATVAAIKYNPVIRAFFHRLVAAGRPGKVGVIAAMRKLLTILNAMLRDRKPWQTA